ncbi:unnamed protein product [Onchocerca flexuosa]|uniref:Flavin-containing monooxygenase n=1 Tax=Onchocerca flexuosa TaxID=387005 RepID=A0A183HQN1_9BILA|nr:unnamed protein product [Onchocerca flexuosa]
MPGRICVIGAGASGLAATKTCLEYGFQVVCFEKSCDIGGLWRYKPDPCPGLNFKNFYFSGIFFSKLTFNFCIF